MKSAITFLKGLLQPKSDAPETPAASQAAETTESLADLIQNTTAPWVEKPKNWEDPSVDVLRQKIIAYCDCWVENFQTTDTKEAFKGKMHYTLHTVTWEQAKACVPGGWDFVHYRLDLETHSLSMYCTCYPNQFGWSPDETFPITPEEFYGVVVSRRFPNELRSFRTANDWNRLFNDDLIAAVNRMRTEGEKSEQRAKEAERSRNAVKIPDELRSQAPELNIIKAEFTVKFPYTRYQISLTREAEKYVLSYLCKPGQFSGYSDYKRELTPAEEVWAERKIAEAKRNPDEETLYSYFSGATVDVRISESHSADCSYHGDPLKKYSEMIDQLCNLAQYGSAAPGNAAERQRKL